MKLMFEIALWIIVVLQLVVIALAIWSNRRSSPSPNSTVSKQGKFEVTRSVVVVGLTPDQQRELTQVLSRDGFDALERRISEMRQSGIIR